MYRPLLALLLLLFSAAGNLPCAQGDTLWRPSLVDRAAGRFGAFGDLYRYRKLGYLSLVSDGADLYSITGGDNLFLGRPGLPSAYDYREEFTWAGARREYGYQTAGGLRQFLRIYESVLAPGFLYQCSDSIFRWEFEEQKAGQAFFLPLADSVRCLTGADRYLAGRDGPLAADPWLIVSFAGSRYEFDCPLLFLFEKPPAYFEVVTHEFMELKFDGPAGGIVVMPLLGIEKLEREDALAWRSSGLPEEIVRAASRWRKFLARYPVGVREEYRFTGDKDGREWLEVKDSYAYVNFSETGEKLAPLPPFVRMAQKTGYPVAIEGHPVETGYPTNYGLLDYVEGDELIYRIPACGYVDRVLCPVRLKNHPRAREIESQLSRYLRDPRWLWPGDHDYIPDDVMDTFHNLRLLAPAAWGLPEKDRRELLRELAEPGVDRVRDGLYYRFTDPVAGRTYARDSTIFAQRGKTSYDSDWYNGFQLAGLWAWRYFGDRERGLKLARDKWELWTELRDYFEIYHDWVTACSVTDPRGNLLDYDCMRNGWSGLLAYARLARDLGYHDAYFQTKYLASKTLVAFYDQWTLPEYFHEVYSRYAPDRGKGLLAWPVDQITGVNRFDSYGPHAFTLPDETNPYNLGACIPEHALFLADFGLNPRVSRLTYDNLERWHPDWAGFDPETLSRSGEWYDANAAGGRYFYYLDPHLFARAINFNEPLEKLLSYRKLDWLSGQALAAMVEGSRPMLVAPTDVEFAGNIWDERTRSLEFTLEGRGVAVVEIRNCGRPVRVIPNADVTYDPQRRMAWINVQLAGRTKTRVEF